MTPADWKEYGHEPASRTQLNLLNAACGDLANQVVWHGLELSKDEYRWMISGTIAGWRPVPAINMGDNGARLIMLGGSSLKLSKSQATDAIQLAFTIGDDPSSQNLDSPSVRWCASVCGARWILPEEE